MRSSPLEAENSIESVFWNRYFAEHLWVILHLVKGFMKAVSPPLHTMTRY